MQVLSVNRSQARIVSYRGQEVRTGVFKEPVIGRIVVRRLGLEGDVQADPRFHGGLLKAVYSYPQEHYAHWETYCGRSLTNGQFGENLTTVGVLENEVCLGDQFRFGTNVLEAVQPRSPCFKLGIKMGDATFPKAFLKAGLPGIYWRVVEEGEVATGDAIEIVSRSKHRISIRDVWRLVHGGEFDPAMAKVIVANFQLGPEWREPLEEKLND
jgi:MOSC domain-containing protein YiiM